MSALGGRDGRVDVGKRGSVHSVRVASLEANEQSCEPQISRTLVQHISTINKVRVVMSQIEVALRVPAQHG